MSAIPKPSEQVISQRVGDDVVLVDLESNRIFELNATGARIWELLQEEVSLDEIGETLSSEFQVSAAQAGEETEEFLGFLREEGLMEDNGG